MLSWKALYNKRNGGLYEVDSGRSDDVLFGYADLAAINKGC